MNLKPLTSAQIRAARALIRWSAEDLARHSSLSVATIRRAELTESETSMTTANDLAVRRTLESAGIDLLFRGLRLVSETDTETIERGYLIMNALYAALENDHRL